MVLRIKIARYIAQHERVIARFPWTEIDADSGEPALWEHNKKIGRLPMRFRTEALARAATDKLIGLRLVRGR